MQAGQAQAKQDDEAPRCKSDDQFTDCAADLVKACGRWRNLCQSTCTPGCDPAADNDNAAVVLESPHVERVEAARAPEAEPQTCLPFSRRLCPPLNLSLLDNKEQKAVHDSCGKYVKQERNLPSPPRFCGAREGRLNPCWSETAGNGSALSYCLPHFFILGEMKCGTTTVYELLLKHPRIVAPRTKEPRYLQQGRFAQTTLSRYAVNFRRAVETAAADTVTFDASPVYLRSKIARFWLARWLPEAKLIVLVRNPVQRSYSHWKMGYEWAHGKCSDGDMAQRLKEVAELLTFSSIIQRSLVVTYWDRCRQLTGGESAPSGFSLMALNDKRLPPAEQRHLHSPAATLNYSAFGRCLLTQDHDLILEYADELRGAWPVEPLKGAMSRAKHAVGSCSEMMMLPPAALQKSGSYAVELERWARIFPRSQIKVIVTDELTRGSQRIMNETFDFLQLPRMPIGNQSRFCVRGKAGVMDVLHASELNITIGHDTSEHAHLLAPQLKVGDCEPDSGHAHDEATGSDLHRIEPRVQERLRRFFEPHNRRLYRFLGRDLGW